MSGAGSKGFVQDEIEKILFRRALEKRLDGYTLETAEEISAACESAMHGGKEGDGERAEAIRSLLDRALHGNDSGWHSCIICGCPERGAHTSECVVVKVLALATPETSPRQLVTCDEVSAPHSMNVCLCTAGHRNPRYVDKELAERSERIHKGLRLDGTVTAATPASPLHECPTGDHDDCTPMEIVEAASPLPLDKPQGGQHES